MLVLKNVTKYIRGVKIIDNNSFVLHAGKITTLIGPNGAGKSTLCNLISGITPLDAGEIFFKKKKISRSSVETIARIGIVRLFQEPRLCKNLSVRDNLLISLDNEDTKFWKNLFYRNTITREKNQKVQQVLNELSLSHIKNTLARELSFGQKRLIELAQLLISPHELLLLDEPLAGVNKKMKRAVANILTTMKRSGKTILLIEHDIPFVHTISDHIIMMNAGKIITKESSSEVFKDLLPSG